MSHSFQQTAEFDCPHCGQHLRAEIWLIVDAAERPDLLEKAKQAHLHEIACPKCGPLGHADAPLLLYFPPGTPSFPQKPPRSALQRDQGGALSLPKQ